MADSQAVSMTPAFTSPLLYSLEELKSTLLPALLCSADGSIRASNDAFRACSGLESMLDKALLEYFSNAATGIDEQHSVRFSLFEAIRAADFGSWRVGSLEPVAVEGEELALIVFQHGAQSTEKPTDSFTAVISPLIESLKEGVLILSADGSVIAANTQASTILGMDRGSLLALNLSLFAASTYSEQGMPIEEREHPVYQTLSSGTPVKDALLYFSHPGGKYILLNLSCAAIPENCGEAPNHVSISFSDITSEYEAQDTLKRDVALYRHLTENSSDMISKQTGDGTLLFVSPASESILGYAPGELVGRNITEFIHPADLDEVRAIYKYLLPGKNAVLSFRFRDNEGGYKTIENTIRKIVSSHRPNEFELIAISRDITARESIAHALQESERRYRTVFDNASDSIYIHEPFGRYIEANSVATSRLGYSREELLSMSPRDIQAPEYYSMFLDHIDRLYDERQLVFETVHIRKDGSAFPVELSMKLIDYGGQEVVMSFSRDITERKEFEEELAKSLALLQSTIESTGDGIVVIAGNGEIITNNKRFEEIWELPSHWSTIRSREKKFSFLASRVRFPSDFGERLQHLDEVQKQSHEVLEFWNGKCYEHYSFPFKIGDNDAGRAWSFRDITERKKAEDELQQSRTHLKAIFDHAGVAIGMLDKGGKFLLVNDRWADLIGVPVYDIVGKDAMTFSHPEDKAEGQENLDAVLNGLSHGYRIEKRYINNMGETIWGDLSVTPIYDEDGTLNAVLGVVSEITQSKKAKEELQAANLELAQRNEELDAFAHTVAHDLKNPLSIIIGYGNLLSNSRDEISYDEINNIYEGVFASADKMKEIIESLLLLSKIRSAEIDRQPVDMGAVVSEAMKHIRGLAQQFNAEIILPERWPVALGYKPWIEEVWANYISNAIKYGGRPPVVVLGADENVNGFVRYWAQDNGKGISREDQPKLFTKFTRVGKNDIEGQGLGLSIVKRIVEKLGGATGVESKPGEGSRFYFTLPVK